MLPRAALAFLAIAFTTALAAGADEIAMVRADGSTGWTASLDTGAPGATNSPLSASVWFARFPGFKIPLTTKESFDLDSARGKVLLIDWWASWCTPCVQELPQLEKLHQKHAPEGLVTVAVNANEEPAIAIEAAKRFGLTMPIGLHADDFYKTLDVHSLPTVLLFDRQGRLRWRWDGYKPGREVEIEAMVVKVLADDKTGTTREFGTISTGGDLLHGAWFRDSSSTAEGVAGLPAGSAGAARVVVSSGEDLLSFDAHGETVGKTKTEFSGGRLLTIGATSDGTYEIAGFRRGAMSAGVIALRSGSEHAVALPAPAIAAAVSHSAAGKPHRVVFATMKGAAEAAPADSTAVLVKDADKVRSVAAAVDGTVTAMMEDGTLARLDGKDGGHRKSTAGNQILIASDTGTLTGPRTLIAAVSGKFLPRDGRQIAIATYAGRVVLVDEASGAVLFDATCSGLHDIAATDLDGDGRDELLVAVGRSVVVLTSAGP